MDWIGLVGSESNSQSVGNQGSVTQLQGQLKMLSQMDVEVVKFYQLPPPLNRFFGRICFYGYGGTPPPPRFGRSPYNRGFTRHFLAQISE